MSVDSLRAAFVALDRAETRPPRESFLDLGRELDRARLIFFMWEAMPVTEGVRGDAFFLLYTATRLHEEKPDAERARLDDEGHVRKRYEAIQTTRQWLLIRDDIRKFAPLALAERDVRSRPLEAVSPPDETPLQFVTLDQMASLVNRSKDTLERRLNKKNTTMPQPDVEGGGGKPHEWRWDRIRPWLIKEFKRDLPERYPTIR